MAYSVIVLYSMMKAPDDENGKISQFHISKILKTKQRHR